MMDGVCAAAVSVQLDGAQTMFNAQAGTLLLDAAEAAGLELPHLCREGHCGACAATLKSGSVTMQACAALSKRDRAAGLILVCQALCTTAVVEISYDG
jgi:ferredoxin